MPVKDPNRYASLAIFALLSSACYQGGDAARGAGGADGDDSSADGRGDGGTGGEGSDSAGDESDGEIGDDSLAPSLMHRLTRLEYNNTVADLVGETSAPANLFPADGRVGSFAANTVAPPSTSELELYMDAAETVAQTAVTKLATVVPCSADGTPAEQCAETFVRTFGRRAFRRTLREEEVQAYMDLFAFGQEQQDFAHGIRVVITGMLQSPNFLYRAEVGEPIPGRDDIVKLTGIEMASRLSYFLWKTMPDEELLAAAEAGELDTPEGIRAQAERMLLTPEGQIKARSAVVEFTRSWLELHELVGVAKNPDIFPEFTTSLSRQMLRETSTFASYVILEDDASLETLFTASYSFANRGLAELYGVEYGGVENEIVRIEHAPTQRSGILTHASLMTVHSHADQTSPVGRGRWIREQLLCQSPPPPPPDVNDEPPAVDPDLPAKERLAMHSDIPSCAGCHTLMDPLGFGFEHYDAIGRFRMKDGNVDVDATGEIVGTVDINGDFDGALELADLLAGSEQVLECVVRQWFRFSQGRVEEDADQPTIDAMLEIFMSTEGDIRELMLAFTTTDAFRYRRLPEA